MTIQQHQLQYADIHLINEIMRGDFNTSRFSKINIDPRVSDYFRLRAYLNRDTRKFTAVYRRSEYKKIKMLCKKHNIEDLGSFILNKLRSL